jgi:hypothetical protein
MSNKWWWSAVIWGIALLACLMSVSSQADPVLHECTLLDCDKLQSKVRLCGNALSACEAVVKQEDISINMLKKQVSNDEDQIVDQQNELKHSDILWFIAGVVLGGAVTYTLHR